MGLFSWAIIDWDDWDDAHHRELERGFWFADMGTSPVQAMHVFVHRWGNLEQEMFRQALIAGNEQDRVIALWVLTWTQDPQTQARVLLLPLVSSADPQERWVSAMMLGEIKEEQVRPLLEELLTEKLPAGDEPVWLQADPYDFWWVRIATILGSWQNPGVVSALRQAFIRIWEIAQKKRAGDKQMWFRFQDELAYAIGRYGAFARSKCNTMLAKKVLTCNLVNNIAERIPRYV